MLLNSGSGSEEPTTRAHLYSDPWDAVSGYAAGTLPRPFPAAPGPLLSPGGARVGGGRKGSLSQWPRSRKTSRSHLPGVGVPRPTARAGNLLHPLTVTSDGIYGAINQSQACLVQPVTARHALGDLRRLLAPGDCGWLWGGRAHSGLRWGALTSTGDAVIPHYSELGGWRPACGAGTPSSTHSTDEETEAEQGEHSKLFPPSDCPG